MRAGEGGEIARRWRGEAPAKVNLRLRVLAREPSGYHQIETIFQRLALADGVEIEIDGGEGVRLRVEGPFAEGLGSPEENLAVRAAHRFGEALEKVGLRLPGMTIRLEKRIPHGAGLGGGSSDAAAVLRGIDTLLGAPVAPDVLLRIGGGLGSDVPYFLTGASRALAWGRGERILPLAPLPARPVLLAVPSPGVPTGWAYGVLAESRAAREADAGGEAASPPFLFPAEGREGWEDVAREAANDFESALFPLRPDLVRVRTALARAGARPALLSGSGSALFGVFEGEEGIEAGARSVEEALPGVHILRTHTLP